MFPLCYTCASTTCLNNCTHKEDERGLIGTWTTVEVNKAIGKGYHMREICEIYHFSRQEKVFSEYVNCFLKIKQEASSFPPECYDSNDAVVDEKVDKYIDDYYNNEGIRLDKENMKYTPGLRTIAKNILNALWGKFAQNENNTKVDFLSEYDELLNLANDKNIELTSVDFVNESITRVTYKKKSINTPLKTGNVIIASFVTAYAQLELFNLIDKLQKSVLYFDTDSVIYLCGERDDVKTGNYLGQLANELIKGEWITHFCSTGPKSYSYITNLNNEIVHIKGFSLNNKNVKEKLHFVSLHSCVEIKIK